MDSMDIKPNYAALGRKYGMDWRTVKKYHEGYQGKPNTRHKGSKLDKYKEEMADKLSIRRVSVRGVYEFLVKKYGIDNIGSYSNFNTYVNKNKLKPGKAVKGIVAAFNIDESTALISVTTPDSMPYSINALLFIVSISLFLVLHILPISSKQVKQWNYRVIYTVFYRNVISCERFSFLLRL